MPSDSLAALRSRSLRLTTPDGETYQINGSAFAEQVREARSLGKTYVPVRARWRPRPLQMYKRPIAIVARARRALSGARRRHGFRVSRRSTGPPGSSDGGEAGEPGEARRHIAARLTFACLPAEARE
jgi:hypothetical protein